MKLALKLGIVFLCIYILGCNNPVSDKKLDSLKIVHVDTQRLQKSPEQKIVDTNFEQVNLDTVLNEYYKQCRDTFRVDTSIIYKKNLLHIKFFHYCTNDSLIQLPQKYLQFYKLRKFITHDFVSSLKIISNDSVLLDTIISKNLFNEYVHEEEVSYGTIFYPVFKLNPNGIRINYSYSIALTDIGVPVYLEYNYYGKLKTRSGY
jgi:hypothetical protein